jgi:hypothetical protein
VRAARLSVLARRMPPLTKEGRASTGTVLECDDGRRSPRSAGGHVRMAADTGHDRRLGLLAAVLVRMALLPGFVLLGDLAPILDWRPTQVGWGFLAVAISLNVIAGAPTGEFGPIIPLTGPVGIAGSTGMILGSIVVVVVLLPGRSPSGQTSLVDRPTSDPPR